MTPPPEDSVTNGEPRRHAMLSGAKAMLPILIGIAPFAAVAGLAGTQNGLSIAETAALSLFAYAGAAQVAALDLIGDGVGAGIVIATALTINLRFIVYSAALAPTFADERLPRRLIGSYLLVDHAVPLTLTETHRRPPHDRVTFYLGACVVFWCTWQTGSLIGSLLGSLPRIGVAQFAVPVSFLALLAPQLRAWPRACAAAVGGAVAVTCAGLPANLGMLLGTATGIAAGVATGWRSADREYKP
ncbi:AzlC family ABC transporter permease [Aeromicrobium sp. CF4.19]|uniref:AzlC family ABC transporter permease n=1 Tax=Aeromicrobium sp. CF4.19 TaxID=3373082 RepID=UPI003EE61406